LSTAIVVDSAAALPAELVEHYAIEVVPMTVVIGGKPRPDTEVTTEELLALIADGTVTTSGPNGADWAAAIDRVRQQADEVVALTVSAEMSSTYDAARLGASSVGDAVHVVDTRSAAGGEALVTLAAARRAHEGGTADEVVAAATTVIERVRLVATLDDLDHLVRSGRVPGLAGSASRRLGINPLFEFRDGATRALRPALGHGAAEHRIIHSCVASRPPDAAAPTLHAAVLEAASQERAQSLLDALRSEVPDADVFVASFGSVMLVHVGPGLVGLAWWWES
jgi:DegV family protein with EDD domain